MMSEKLDKLKAEAQHLHRLLEDPHPGLFTWTEALDAQLDQLYTAARDINWTPPLEHKE